MHHHSDGCQGDGGHRITPEVEDEWSLNSPGASNKAGIIINTNKKSQNTCKTSLESWGTTTTIFDPRSTFLFPSSTRLGLSAFHTRWNENPTDNHHIPLGSEFATAGGVKVRRK